MADVKNITLQPNAILVGERAFEAATLLLIGSAERELLIFDPDLSRGAYQSLQCSDALSDFLARDRQNRLSIVLHNTNFLFGNCPRLIDLMQTYAHAIAVYSTDESARVAQDAFILADSKHSLHRFHIDQARFRYILHDEVSVKPLQERFEQLLEATDSMVSATSTGL